MNEITKKKIFNSSADLLAVCTALAACFCLTLKLKSNFNFENFSFFAAKTAFFRSKAPSLGGGLFPANLSLEEDQQWGREEKSRYSIFSPKKSKDFKLPEVKNQNDDDDDGPKLPGEKTCKIIESQFGSGGTKFENFFVKNNTGFNLDIGAELAKRPEIEIKKTDKPQVLIMHTHATESFMKKDQGFFYESYHPRSGNDEKNVTAVGASIAQVLEKHGIKTIHDKSHNDEPTHKDYYHRAGKLIKEHLEQNPSIQVVLDIHRDSMGSAESGKIKPTFSYSGEKAAQIMVIAGCDTDGSIGHPNWEKNLRLALRLQKSCETLFPGFTRPMKFDKVKYNMHITPGSLLVEVGSDVNTLEEAIRSGAMLGEAVTKVLLN